MNNILSVADLIRILKDCNPSSSVCLYDCEDGTRSDIFIGSIDTTMQDETIIDININDNIKFKEIR